MPTPVDRNYRLARHRARRARRRTGRKQVRVFPKWEALIIALIEDERLTPQAAEDDQKVSAAATSVLEDYVTHVRIQRQR